MNNKIIAMAIAAGLAFPVAAMAAPSVGGHMQVELNQPDLKDSASTSADELNTADNARGRLWIKGSEDLGGGMKAIYKAEWKIDTTKGGAASGNRESYVGLKGNFGTVYAGNGASPYKSNAGTDFDPYTATVLEGRSNGGALTAEGSMTKNYGINSFLADSISYKKKFGDVSVHAQYHLNESTVRDNTFGLAVRYKAGAGINVIVATITEDASTLAGTVKTKIGGTRTKLGVSWKGGPHKVLARFETQSDDVADNDATAVFLGYHMTMGKNVMTIQYGTIDGKAAADDKTYTMLAVKHNLSKKTAAWVGYRSTDYKEDGTAPLAVTNTDNSVISLGLRIKF